MIVAADISVGILAGGAGSRAGGNDKGWMSRGGQAQIRWLLECIPTSVPVMISANRNLDAYAALDATSHAVQVVVDRWGGFAGPLAGLASLLAACHTHRLVSLPVDLQLLPHDLVARLGAAQAAVPDHVAIVEDDGGAQPLVALWPVALADAAVRAFEAGERSVRGWQRTLRCIAVPMPGVRLGNLNATAQFAASTG